MAIQDFRHKVIVITGAASGIGRATALAFAREGACIIAADLSHDALRCLAQDIKALGAQCTTHVVDVSDQAAMAGFAEAVVAIMGAPHVLINNAGIGYLGAFLQSDLAHWRQVLDVNVMGVTHGCYYFLPAMIAAGGARHVLNVSSSAGNFPSPSMAAYAASKGAVSRLSEVLQMELIDTAVRVTTVCPGVINTPIVRARHNMAASITDKQIAALQAYYEREGCSPDVVAQDMVRAVRNDAQIVLTGPGAALVYHLRRLSLRAVRAAMVRFSRQSGYL